jgi:hypothetical protein
MKKLVVLLVAVVGCAEIDQLRNKPTDAEMESFVSEATGKSGIELKSTRYSDPSVHAWDDVPLEELPDNERAEKELRRAKSFSAEVMVEGELWNVGYKRFGNAWMLSNVSLALINKRSEVLYTSTNSRNSRLPKVMAHSVFKHFIPPKHDQAKRAHDAIRKRMRSGSQPFARLQRAS